MSLSQPKKFQFLPGLDRIISSDREDKTLVVKLFTEIFREYACIKDESTIKVDDCSDLGGSFTYKVHSPKNPDVLPLCLHSRVVEPDLDPFIEPRMRKCHEILYNRGIMPPRICSGETWWVEPFIFVDKTKTSLADFAVLMAEIHKCPTDWFPEFREKYLARWPVLEKVGPGSHIWTYVANAQHWFQDEVYSPEDMDFWIDAENEPLSAPARRVVTVHSDFHDGNTLLQDGKLYIIDLEYINVSWAVHDFCFLYYWLFRSFPDTPNVLRDFFKTYLDHSGFGSSEQDISDVIFDTECARLRHFHLAPLWQDLE